MIENYMNDINASIPFPNIDGVEFAQVGWVVPDIHAAVKFFNETLGVKGFPTAVHVRAQELKMTYRGNIEEAEWLTTQTFSGGSFIELIQPLKGKSMFNDYLQKCPAGGIQHLAFRLPVSGFDKVTERLHAQGFSSISRVDHPVALMEFFDTYNMVGVVTEIMGVTPEGWEAIEQMKKNEDQA